MVARHNKSEKSGKEFRKSLMKIVVKILLLHDGKQLSDDDFSSIVRFFRKLCSLIKNTYRGNLMQGRKGEIDEKQLARLREIAQEIFELTRNLLSPHLTQNSIDKIKEIVEYLSSNEFIVFAFADEAADRLIVILTDILQSTES